MVGDTYFNANVTNEAIVFGGNRGIYIPDLGWRFTAAHYIGEADKGVGDTPPTPPYLSD